MRVKAWISAFILVVGVLHAVPILQQIRGPGQSLWPIMAWGMYRSSHQPPIETAKWEIFVETDSGDRWQVGSHAAGLGSSAFSSIYIQPMAEGDSAAAHRLASRLEAGRQGRISRLVVLGTAYKLGEGGVIATSEDSIVYTLGDR